MLLCRTRAFTMKLATSTLNTLTACATHLPGHTSFPVSALTVWQGYLTYFQNDIQPTSQPTDIQKLTIWHCGV